MYQETTPHIFDTTPRDPAFLAYTHYQQYYYEYMKRRTSSETYPADTEQGETVNSRAEVNRHKDMCFGGVVARA